MEMEYRPESAPRKIELRSAIARAAFDDLSEADRNLLRNDAEHVVNAALSKDSAEPIAIRETLDEYGIRPLQAPLGRTDDRQYTAYRRFLINAFTRQRLLHQQSEAA